MNLTLLFIFPLILVALIIYFENFFFKNKDTHQELIDDNNWDLIDEYTLLIKKGMDKNEAIGRLLENDNINKSFSKHELDMIIVSDIGDSKIADLNKDFDWELPPTSPEAERLINKYTLKVKNGDYSVTSLHDAVDELYTHEEVQKYFGRDDLLYIVDERSGFVIDAKK